MKIEIAREDRMAMKGSALKRILQNESMPLLDLFVRESIQNSLDAAIKSESSVEVDLGIKTFNSWKASNLFEGISGNLNKMFPNETQKYLYISDKNTIGLTGAMHFSEVDDNNSGNLIKLVYDIGNPQELQDSGGSWGYGKTIYYRMGIGIVLYYSRIEKKNGEYESRLAACLVEDEKSPNALLSKLESRRGIAWWGKEYCFTREDRKEYATIPITEDKQISEILSFFNLNQYENQETGTIVIIPFIDENKLLHENIEHAIDTTQYNVNWINDINSYLKISTQRWYNARINNRQYREKYKQPYLIASINGEKISCGKFSATFNMIRKLYDAALNENDSNNENIEVKKITLRNLFEDSNAGYVAYKKVTKEELKMNAPTNNVDPFAYIYNKEQKEEQYGIPIILAFFRKPGMVVSYEKSGDWIKGIRNIEINSDEILFITFVLNSENHLYPFNSLIPTIEEYFRSSENADHTSWVDKSVNGKMPNILAKIQRHIASAINDTYEKRNTEVSIRNSSLAKLFGNVLLPPEGFGIKASGTSNLPKASRDILKHKNYVVKSFDNKTKFVDGKLISYVNITCRNQINCFSFYTEIVADGKNISMKDWIENLNLPVPFGIDYIGIKLKTIDKKEIEVQNFNINNGFSTKILGLYFHPMNLEHGNMYGFEIVCNKPIAFNIDLEIAIKIINKETKIGYRFKDSEEKI